MSGRADHMLALLEALRALGGRATAGDLVAKTTLALADVEQSILPALSQVGGHVAVDDRGTLLYTIDRTTPLPGRPWLGKVLRAAYVIFQTAFFTALSVALVGYGLVYIALVLAVLIAGLVAAAQGGDCDCDCGGCKGCSGCDLNGCGDGCYRKTVARKRPDKVAAREALRSTQERVRAAKTAEKLAKADARRERWRRVLTSFRGAPNALEKERVAGEPKFFRAVHDFVFGPPRPPVDPDARDRDLIGFIREHHGRMTATDAAMVTGLPIDQADRVLLALTVKVGGDVEATEGGAVVYTFDQLMPTGGPALDELRWIVRQGGTVTLAAFAMNFVLGSEDALARLQQLVTMTGGEVLHGERTVFRFPLDAEARMADAVRTHDALRDFSYSWERMEKAPAILGIPPNSGGWIWAFNILNLVVSLGLCFFYSTGARIFDGGWEVTWLGVAPLAMSTAVFVIPLVRAIVEGVRNVRRRARNDHRRVFVALVHALEAKASVSAAEVSSALGLGWLDASATTDHLERLARELDGDFDPADPDRFRFARVHRELAAVQHARDELDPQRFALAPIVFDTASTQA